MLGNQAVKTLLAAALCAGALWPCATPAIPEGPAYPSAEWLQREAQNYAKVAEAPAEQLNPAFLQRTLTQGLTNTLALVQRDTLDPSWLLASSTPLDQILAAIQNPAALSATLIQVTQQVQQNPASIASISLDSPFTPPCETYSLICAGDPFRWAEANGPDGDGFYGKVATATDLVFYDTDCARLTARVWQPLGVPAGKTLPGVVILNGSIEAPQPLYWWAAQLLARNGYVVLTFDPRGQGRSDQQSPGGGQGTNLNPAVFWDGLVDAIDFFRSSPAHPYPHNLACAGTYPTAVAPYNPAWAMVDPARLGIAGHSLGATGVSVVQGYGAAGADPWPGKLDASNPVKAAVAWDALGAGSSMGSPQEVPRVPALGMSSEYGLTPVPFTSPPDPELKKAVAYDAWVKAGVPVFQITIQGSTHYDFSLAQPLPATSWCPDPASGACEGGYGNAMAQHYTLAWFDRWLKQPGEPGYADADARLLDDAGAQGAAKMSFYTRSARDYPARDGSIQHCEDIRAGCSVSGGPAEGGAGGSGGGSGGSGGAVAPLTLLLLGAAALRRRRHVSSHPA